MSALRRQQIVSPGGELHAQFVPEAGMVCCSLRRGERELLAPGAGIDAYAERGVTMGIPLLYPWANRLAGYTYEAAGRRVSLPRDSPLLPRDPNGLPIHGVIPGRLHWQTAADAPSSSIAASLSWDQPELLELFPFPHRLSYEATLSDEALRIAVTVHADAGPVPVSFGFHPYLALAPGARAHAEVELPVSSRLVLDDRMIPTGETVAFAPGRHALGERDWDDAFAGPEPPATVAVLAGRERTELEFEQGYRCSQLYSPRKAGFVCVEPMTAPANALVSDRAPVLASGASFRASFSVRPARAVADSC